MKISSESLTGLQALSDKQCVSCGSAQTTTVVLGLGFRVAAGSMCPDSPACQHIFNKTWRKISVMQQEVTVDSEFQALIPPLTVEERNQLEVNLIAEGCLEIHPDQASYLRGQRYNAEKQQDKLLSDKKTRARKAWIYLARQEFNPGQRQPCFVCGKYQSITHAHHSSPLSLQFSYGITSPIQDSVWLCPNHHTLIHATIDFVLSGANSCWFAKDIEINEWLILLEIARNGVNKIKGDAQ